MPTEVDEMNAIRTSVIVPVYNTEKYLGACLDSLVRQTQKEIQVIIVDDGSTDNSMQVVRGYQSLFENICVIEQENKGLGAARNTGMRAATGEFLYFLDSDDFIEKETLEKCYDCAAGHGLDVVLFDALTLAENDAGNITAGNYDRRDIIRESRRTFTGRTFLEHYMERNPYVVSACLMYLRRSFAIEHSLVFREGVIHEDEEYHFRMMMADPRIRYLPETFYGRRYRAGSIMTMPAERQRLKDYISLLEIMTGMADGNDMLAMNYLSRKIWPAFTRYHALVRSMDTKAGRIAARDAGRTEVLQNDRNIQEFTRALHRMMCHFHEKFHSCIHEKDQVLYDYQELCLGGAGMEQTTESICAGRNERLREAFKELPLGEKGRITAIYGLGEHTEKLLREYEALSGTSEPDIVFIDSHRKSFSEKYRNCDVCNVKDIGIFPVKDIIISSYLFEKDMCETITNLYGDRYRLIRLYDRNPFVLLPFIERSCVWIENKGSGDRK